MKGNAEKSTKIKTHESFQLGSARVRAQRRARPRLIDFCARLETFLPPPKPRDRPKDPTVAPAFTFLALPPLVRSFGLSHRYWRLPVSIFRVPLLSSRAAPRLRFYQARDERGAAARRVRQSAEILLILDRNMLETSNLVRG